MQSLSDIDFDHIGELPWLFKGLAMLLLFIVIVVAAFFLLGKPLLHGYDNQIVKERVLKKTLQDKYAQVSNLEAYRAQLNTLRIRFNRLLDQLPNTNEVPALLESISLIGQKAGLEFRLIRPLSEVKSQFYVELPIEISVSGNYQQISQFISALSAMSRIVTVDNFTITQADKNQPGQKLNLLMRASTYRYEAGAQNANKATQ